MSEATSLIRVRVTPKARREKIIEIGPARYDIAVREPAEDNRANEAVLALLAAFLKKPRKALRLVAGHHTPSKRVEVQN